MKFGKRFENSKIAEWADFYVSYRPLKKLLSPFKAISKYHLHCTMNNNRFSIKNFSDEDLQKLEYFIKSFQKVVFDDLEKLLVFYNIQFNQTISKWRKLKINLIIYKQKQDNLKKDVREEYFSMLKGSFQTLIKELKLLTDYVNINLEAFQKILKKQAKVTNPIFPNNGIKNQFEKYLIETKTFLMRDQLNNFLYSVENEYMDFFHKNRSEGIMELRKIFQGNLISRNESFWFGLYFGFTALLIFVMIILAWDENLDIDDDELFKEIFPIFRGMAIIILYIWLLAWNVYGWTSYNVNYKLIFRFNHHYSQLSQILKRAAGFSTLLLLVILWYMLLEGGTGKFARAVDFIPKEILPLLVWVVFLVYMLFPYKRVLNGPGRWYTFRMIKNIMKTPFIPITFSIIWATDQLTSFVLPLKDLEYTICYYIAYFFSDEQDMHQCQSSKRFTKGVIMATIPLILRALQCLRQVYDNRQNKRDPLLNFGKYSCSLIVAILSYLVTVFNSATPAFVTWIVFAAISTVYSYIWDLRKDWAFLEKGAKYRFLRNQLSYNKPLLYYIALFGNLIMRLAWVLSISPDVMAQVIRPELFSLIIGFVEILRRAVWNFLRVEKEHIANVGSFKVVADLRLPFNEIKFHSDAEDELFYQDLRTILNKSGITEKPISNAGITLCKYAMLKSIEKSTDGDDDQDRLNPTEPAENEEDNLRLKQLSQLTSDPLRLMNNEKEDLSKGLLKYKQETSGLGSLSKEISKFKQKIQKKANKFEIVVIPADDNKPNQSNIVTGYPKQEPSSPSKSKIQSIILLDTEAQHEAEGDNEPSPNNLSETENKDPNVLQSNRPRQKTNNKDPSPIIVQPKFRKFKEKKLFFADKFGDKLPKVTEGEQPTLVEMSKTRKNFRSNPDFHVSEA